MGRFALQEATRTTYLTTAIFRLLAAFGTDFLNQFLPEVPQVFSPAQFVNTIHSEFVISPDMKFIHQKATWSTIGAVGSTHFLPELFSILSISVFENFS
ncbi:hypothetical protein FS749_004684 [Ceratobasidium sp. UAMH 11750]|nr:hypothetical protein FS749_004684 [Ceratobasidium sp. UAMH 11750]